MLIKNIKTLEILFNGSICIDSKSLLKSSQNVVSVKSSISMRLSNKPSQKITNSIKNTSNFIAQYEKYSI